jgi:hypothetical protein
MRSELAVMIALSAGLLVATQSPAGEATSQSAANRRQLIDCMTKRMSINKALSYNDAMRACKDRTQASKEALAANGPVESAAKPSR